MKLIVSFNDELIKNYVERGRSPLFSIYWTNNQVSYPENQWIDFGSVVLSWWLVAARSLIEGATEVELLFMDGPYRLKLHHIGNLIYISSDDFSGQWKTSMESFVGELVNAANQVQKKFVELGISDKECLQVGVQHLKAAISQSQLHEVNKQPTATAYVLR